MACVYNRKNIDGKSCIVFFTIHSGVKTRDSGISFYRVGMARNSYCYH